MTSGAIVHTRCSDLVTSPDAGIIQGMILAPDTLPNDPELLKQMLLEAIDKRQSDQHTIQVLQEQVAQGLRRIERAKASTRAKVEHPFRVIKCQFGFTKVRYKGLAKNTAQLHTLFALANLWMARKQLLSAG